MREQQAQIQHAFIGPTELFVDVLCGDMQHDAHVKGWRWEAYLASAKRASAAVREEGLRIIAARNVRIALNEIIQIAAE
jgi:hypothetical protein